MKISFNKKFIVFLLIIIIIILIIPIYKLYDINNIYDKFNIKTYTKKYNFTNKTNKFSSLKPKEQFILEKDCLLKLEKNFKCQCKIKKNHFPRIIYIKEGKGQSLIKMTHLGPSVKDFKKLNIKIHKSILYEQIDCILYNLNNNNIVHLDMHSDGKNMTIGSNNVLGLIDFGLVYINNYDKKFFTKKIQNRIKKTKKNTKEHFYNIIKDIIINS